MTVEMTVEGAIKKKRRTCSIRWEGGQAVPVDIQTSPINRVDCLMKHMTFVDVIAVRQTGSNRYNSKKRCQKENCAPAQPVEKWRSRRWFSRLAHDLNQRGRPWSDIQRLLQLCSELWPSCVDRILGGSRGVRQ